MAMAMVEVEGDDIRPSALSMRLSSLARTLAERATRRWVYARRFPTAFGGAPIFVTPSAGLKFLLKPMSKTDPILFRNIIELVRSGDVVWDIGANIGLFAFAAAARAGRNGQVIAFEPDAWLVQILRRSASAQPDASSPVRIIPAAVASDIGLRQFAIASRSRASNALTGYGQSQMGTTYEEQTIVALPLDWLAEKLPPPNVVKCDVEGAEVEVFSGQSNMLENIRPVIICEVSGETSDCMTDILVKQRYRLYDGEKPLSQDAEVARASWNTIGIPAELRHRYIIDSLISK
jgi:FkbM family methyltransferase